MTTEQNKNDKCITRYKSDEEYDEYQRYEIEFGDVSLTFNCASDCPEDNNMDRAFNDVFLIPNLIEAA